MTRTLLILFVLAAAPSTMVPTPAITKQITRAAERADSFAASVVAICDSPDVLTTEECIRWKRLAERAQFAAFQARTHLIAGDLAAARAALRTISLTTEQFEEETPHAP